MVLAIFNTGTDVIYLFSTYRLSQGGILEGADSGSSNSSNGQDEGKGAGQQPRNPSLDYHLIFIASVLTVVVPLVLNFLIIMKAL